MKKFAVFFIMLFSVELLFSNISLALSPEEQSLLLQQQLIQQQEQLRQRERYGQNIEETNRIKENRLAAEDIDKSKTKCSPDDIKCLRKLKNEQDRKRDCPYRFDHIKLKGNKIYSTKTLNKKILNSFIGSCITKDNVQELQAWLTNFYISNGYTTTRVYFDMDNVKREKITKKEITKVLDKKTGTYFDKEITKEEVETTFIVVIKEGKINNLKLDVVNPAKKSKNKPISKFKQFRRSSQIFFAFPFKKNKIFNMKDFEQGLDQMNRLQSNSVTVEVRPSITMNDVDTGYSDIILINNKSNLSTGNRTTFLNVNYNNNGNQNTGINNLNLSISQDNLLGINDNVYISYTESSDSLFFTHDNRCNNGNNNDPDIPTCDNNKNPFKNKLDFFNNDDNKLRYSKNLYTNLSFPFGYYTISGGINYSTYKTTNRGYYNIFNTTGKTVTQSYSIDRTLYRTKNYKLSIGNTLELRNIESYLLDLKSSVGSRKMTNTNIYLNNTIYTKAGVIIIRPSYQKGLNLFNGGYKNIKTLKTEPELQYDLIKLYFYYSTKLYLPLLTKTQLLDQDGNNINVRNRLPLSYTLTFDSQYSFHTLYGVDQFSIGGEYTTRGFKESVISGDNGFYIRNDVRVNMYQLLPNFLTNSKNNIMNYNTIFFFKESINSLLSKTYLNIFYDYGYIKDRYRDSSDIKYNSNRAYLSGVGIGLSYYGNYITTSLTYSRALHSPQYLQTRDEMDVETTSVYLRVGMKW